MKSELRLNPWLSIWTRPRQTIRALVAYDVNFRLLLLVMIYGFQHMLHIAQFLSMGRGGNLFTILLIILISCVPIGYILLNISSAFLFWIGKLVKGTGTFKQIRSANYWSSVPYLVIILTWIVLMVAYGSDLFTMDYKKELPGIGMRLSIGVNLVRIIFGTWVVVIFAQALGEVQGFSAWMALLNIFLAGLAIFISSSTIFWGISKIFDAS